MKTLILHSCQITAKKQLDKELIKLIDPASAKIGYIPSESDVKRQYYQLLQAWYEQFGYSDFLYFDLDREYDESLTNDLFSCQIIHLSGGNTYYFLDSLIKRNFLTKIQTFVDSGGILVGVSAGSILMSKHIKICQFFDENEVELKDQQALNLVDFEFYPHYERNNPEIKAKLVKYSRRTQNIIYACEDGDGIIINNGKTQFIGDMFQFRKGKLTEIYRDKQAEN